MSRRLGLTQYFKENWFTVLKKECKLVPPPVEMDDKADEDGITDSMLEFSWDRDVEPTVRVLCRTCVCVDVAD